MNAFLSYILRPYVRRELPGWGRVYRTFIGGYEKNQHWVDADPRVIRDKRYGKIRILDIRDWADRIFYFLGRWYDLKTQLILEHILKPGDTVVDVGANYGHFSLSAASIVGETGKVLAFEPNPATFARLRTHIALNKLSTIQAQNVGLADMPSELKLSVPKINSGEATFTETPYDEAEFFTCPVLVGDDVIAETKAILIKIDVEGFEMRVLKGLEKTIMRDKPWIITEIVRGHLARDGCTPADLEAFLCPKGYKPLQIDLSGAWGAPKKSALYPYDSTAEKADVLWVPEGRADQIDFSAPPKG